MQCNYVCPLKFILGPSQTWWSAFMKRNPRLVSRVPESLSKAASVVNSRNLDIWFEKYIAYLEHKQIFELINSDPRRNLNLDESGFDLNALPKKIWTTREVGHAYKSDAGKKNEHITVTMCIDAEGFIFTPQIIFKLAFSRVEDAAYCSGCMFNFYFRGFSKK